MSIDGKERPRIRVARAVVISAAVVVIVAGLLLGAGWGTFCALGLDAVAVLCPLGALETMLAAKLAIPPVVVAVVCMLAVVALLGRAFCAWMCPVPPLQRFFRRSPKSREEALRSERPSASGSGGHGAEGGSTGKVPMPEGRDGIAGAISTTAEQLSMPLSVLPGENACAACGQCLAPVGGARDGLQLDSRHGVLAGALVSSAIFGFPVFCLVCPVGLTFATLVVLWRTFAEHDPSWMLLVFPAILVAELLIFRKWCHRLCPLGALMSLVGAKAPLGRPRVDSGKCLRCSGVDCRACANACPEQLDPHSRDIPECTRCGACLEACPSNAIRMLRKK